MKSCIVCCLAFLWIMPVSAQKLSPETRKELLKKEDSLKLEAPKMLVSPNPAERLQVDSILTRTLVRALRMPYSFYYPFDSLFTISKLYAPDSSFRIFTWQVPVNEDLVRQHGAIQINTPDGSLKLFPLIDQSDVVENMEDSILNHQKWMGAVYYKLLMHRLGERKIYTLLGYDENDSRSNKKIIEVLEFVQGEPRFGARIFRFPNNSLKASTPARYIMEFKKDAGPRLTYDDELGMIIMEHLVSETNEPAKKYTLVGDGDYEGFRWANGKWVYVSKIFNEVTPEGKAPVPQPIRDDKGNIDESKLKVTGEKP